MVLKSIIYGGIDGIITISNIIASIEGVKLNTKYILAISISVLMTGAMSMGIADYLSTRAENKHKQEPESKMTDNPIYNGITTFISFIMFGLIPLLMFYLITHLNIRNRIYSMVISMSVAFFILGSLQTLFTDEIWWKSGLTIVAYGDFTTLAAYYISKNIEI
jgi:VIT1/CCC1 family predicted Fe2+/Mn2+ transporter